MYRLNDLSRRFFALLLGTVIVLVLCLGVFYTHSLAEGIPHTRGESQADASGPDLDHAGSPDEIALSTIVMPDISRGGVPRLPGNDYLYLFSPCLSPLLPPPITPEIA